MSLDSKYLTAVGDYYGSTQAVRESLKREDRIRAVGHGVRAAGHILQRLVYGSALTFVYAVTPDITVEVNRDFERAYGRAVGAAVGEMMLLGEALPPSFAQRPMAEAIIAKNAK